MEVVIKVLERFHFEGIVPELIDVHQDTQRLIEMVVVAWVYLVVLLSAVGDSLEDFDVRHSYQWKTCVLVPH
jgi:hypothetical protein